MKVRWAVTGGIFPFPHTLPQKEKHAVLRAPEFFYLCEKFEIRGGPSPIAGNPHSKDFAWGFEHIFLKPGIVMSIALIYLAFNFSVCIKKDPRIGRNQSVLSVFPLGFQPFSRFRDDAFRFAVYCNADI